MTDPSRQHLRLVTDGEEPRADTDDMAGLWIDTGDADPLLDGRHVPERPEPKRPRFNRSKHPWGRVNLSELADHRVFSPLVRLLVVLRYRSHDGQETVRLDQEVADAASIPIRDKSRYARQLEKCGKIRIERDGQRMMIITVIPV
jgi:hypothetical protein